MVTIHWYPVNCGEICGDGRLFAHLRYPSGVSPNNEDASICAYDDGVGVFPKTKHLQVTGGNGYHGIQLDDLVLDPLLDAIRTNSSRPP